MAAHSPQPTDHEVTPGCTLGRRDLMRNAAIGAAAIATAGAASSTVTASDDYDDVPTVGAGSYNTKGGLDDLPGAAAVKSLYDALGGLFTTGYDRDETEAMLAENQHRENYETWEVTMRTLEGFMAEAKNFTMPDDPTASPLMDVVWGEARASVFRDIGSDKSQQEITDDAIAAAEDRLAETEKNYVRQWNEMIWSFTRQLMAFGGTEDENPDHYDGTSSESSYTFNGEDTTTEGLEIRYTFRAHNGNSWKTSGDFDIGPDTYECVNGDVEDTYVWDFANSSYSTANNGPTDRFAFEVIHPDDGTNAKSTNAEGTRMGGFPDIFDAIDAVHSELTNNFETYSADVQTEVSAGDLEDVDILAPSDYAREFGDADDFTRLDAEMNALGLQSPDDRSDHITLAWDDDGTIREETGILYADWDFTELSDWEYTYEADDLRVLIDEDSYMSEAVYTFVFEDADGNEVTVDVAADDLEVVESDTDDTADYAYYHEFDADNGTFQTVRVDAEGTLSAFVPEGQGFTFGENGTAQTAVFAFEESYETADGDLETYLNRYRFDAGDSVTLKEASDGRLTLTGYNTKTRDPARALDEAEYLADQRKDTEDLAESEGIGLPSFDFADLGDSFVGLAIIGGVLLVIVSVVIDAIPVLGR